MIRSVLLATILSLGSLSAVRAHATAYTVTANEPGFTEPMPEAVYWKLIEASLQHTETLEDQEEYLSEALEAMMPEQLAGFKLRTDQLLMDSYSSPLWCAAYLMKGGCGEEDFTFFRCWLISRGQKIYTIGIQHPDDIAFAVQTNINSAFDFEALQTLPEAIFKKKTDQELNTAIDYTQVHTRPEDYPSLEINWREQVPGTMQAICPKLYQLFWEQQ